MADGRVVIDTTLDNKGFTRGVSGLKGELGGLTSVVKKLGAVIGVAFGVKALVDFSRAAIDLGSNVAEVQNVVDVAFGDMAYKIENFAKSSIQNFGMSKLAAKKTASTYMAMAKGMGMAEGPASDMAIALTGLTGDVASFFNISQELADTKLKSVFTGETETLKDLGVVMTQTNLKAYALSKGITKDIEAMSQAELVSLRYKFVTDQLALSHGDFARTSDSWANQTRILSEQWKEFMSIVGQALITVLRPLVVTLNEIVSSMIDTANAVNNIVTALFGGTSTQMQQTQQNADGVSDAIEGSVENQDDLTGAVEETNKAQKKSLANFDEINKLSGQTAQSAESPNAGGGPAGSGSTSTVIEGMSEKMAAMIESLRAGFEELKGWLIDFFKPFQESWETSGEAVINSAKLTVSKILELLRSIGTTFINVWSNDTGVKILNTIHSIIAKIFEIAGTLAERFHIAWEANNNGEAIWRAILGIIQSVVSFVDRLVTATLEWMRGLDLEPIVSSFRRFLDALKPVVDLILDGLAWGYENVLLPLASWVIEDAAPAVLDMFAAALEALTPVIEALQPLAIWLWESFLRPLGTWTGEIVIQAIQWLTDKFRAFSDWARENPEVIRKIGETIMALLAGVLAYQTVHKIAEVIGQIRLAFAGFASGLSLVNIQAGAAVLAFGAIAAAIVGLVSCWDQLSGVQKVIGVLGALVAVAFAAALAVGAFQSALTMGLAVAAIVAGVAAMAAVISSAKSQASAYSASSFIPAAGGAGLRTTSALSTANLPHLAKGAVIPANREFLAVLGDQKNGTNVEAPLDTIKQALYEVMAELGGTRPTEIKLLVMAGDSLTRDFKFKLDRETQRQGTKLVKVGSY